MTSIYIHYPYCLSKCHYCDFISFPCLNKEMENLTDFYLKELDYFNTITKNDEITSIYFGGGTPSLMPLSMLESILNHINKLWHIKKDIEITIEANPKTITKDKLKAYKTYNINRLSIGIQSLNNDSLKFLGRIHDKEDALQTLSLAQSYFDNINADFIYAIPNQTLSMWENELRDIVKLNLPHLSLYELIIEENTKLYKDVIAGKVNIINENIATDMYILTNEYLKNTTPQYEVSNYAKTSYQSQHNINYWEGGDYIGIGVASASRITKNKKFYLNENEPTISKWKEKINDNNWHFEELTQNERAEELIIMGLRQIKGISITQFENIIGDSFFNFIDMKKLQNMIDNDFIILNDNNIKTTNKGMLVLDSILREIIK